jgi:hypothetical protein
MVTDGPEPRRGSGRGRLRVAIVGGGIGALEALLALRDLAEERVEITLLSPGVRVSLPAGVDRGAVRWRPG